MANATDWLRSEWQRSPPEKLEGSSRRAIDLVKFPNEAVGSEREDSRAAVHLLLFCVFFQRALSQRATMHRSSSPATLIRFPVIYYLTPIYQVQFQKTADIRPDLAADRRGIGSSQ